MNLITFSFANLDFQVEYEVEEGYEQTFDSPGMEAGVETGRIFYNGKLVKKPSKQLEEAAYNAAKDDAFSYTEEDALADKADQDRDSY